MGTPRYLAPEQATGAPATPRSDVYAVGVLCYEMVTGTTSFTGDSAAAILTAHQRAPVPLLRASRPDAADRYARAVERSVAEDPEQGAVVALLADSSGDGHRTASRAVVPTRPATTVPTVPPTASPTTVRVDVPARPQTLEQLVALVAARPELSGERAEQLLARIEKLLGEAGPDAAKEAEKVVREIDRSVARGELDPAIGGIAAALVADYAGASAAEGRSTTGKPE